MDAIIIILRLIIPIGILLFYTNLRAGINSGKLSNIPFTYIDGITNLSPGIKVFVSFTKDKIIIDEKHFIPFSRINGLTFVSTKQLTEHQKSVITRVLAGGVLFGTLGARRSVGSWTK